MPLSPAMLKALDLHPAQAIPAGQAWDNADDRLLAMRVLNRVRASILDDSWPHKVFAFHRLYKMPGGDGPIKQLDSMRRILRQRLLAEEVKETIEADLAGDIVETIDGLLDTIYVAIGWLLELGLTPEQINKAMEEVHASNLTKVDNNGQPVYDDGGKVLKGDNYTRVDLCLVLDLLADNTGENDGPGGTSIPVE